MTDLENLAIAAREHAEAVKVMAGALREWFALAHTLENSERYATALLARLAAAGFVLERIDTEEKT